MATWIRMVMATAVALLPGGIVFLLAYVFARSLYRGWQDAAREANGGQVQLRDIFAATRFRESFRSVRLASGSATR